MTNLRACLLIAIVLAAAPAAAQNNPAPPDSARGNLPESQALIAPIAPVAPPTPPDFPRGRISGNIFGDLYYNVSGVPTHVYSASGADLGQANIDAVKPITQDLNGIQVRRVYFQLDNDLSVRYATRVRFELDNKTTAADGKVTAYLKNAYFQAKSAIPRGDAFVGMIATPTFENAETFWNYRSIEKTIVDFRGLASSSDFGLSLKGFADPDHRVGYWLMLGDGTGQRVETDRFKRVYFSIPSRFGDLRVEPYVDYQAMRVNLQPALATSEDSVSVNQDQALVKLFVGYEIGRTAIGGEALTRVNHMGPAPTREPRGVSLFARGPLTSTLGWVARVDQWQPDHRADSRVDSRLWIAGVDWQPFKDVHLMPNFEAIEYLARGAAVAPAHHDLQARITFYMLFSRPQS